MLNVTDIITNYHKIHNKIEMDLMSQYRISLVKFFNAKGYDGKIQDIHKARNIMQRIFQNLEHNFSLKEKFIYIVENYYGEEILEEIYFDLFKDDIFTPEIFRKKFKRMTFVVKCLHVYKNIPKHAKNYFDLYFYGCAVCMLQNKQNYQTFKKLEILNNDTNSILEQYMC